MDATTDDSGLPRFSRVTSKDHAGQLWIITIVSLIYSIMGAMARAYIKYKMIGYDDILLFLATVRTFATHCDQG